MPVHRIADARWGWRGRRATSAASSCAGSPRTRTSRSPSRPRSATSARAVARPRAVARRGLPRRCVSADHRAGRLSGCDVVFVALPHGRSAPLVAELRGARACVVDLGADLRLADAETLGSAGTGARTLRPSSSAPPSTGSSSGTAHELAGARLVAVPGCYPTAAILAARRRSSTPGSPATGQVVVDALSGASGAGRGARASAALRGPRRRRHRLRRSTATATPPRWSTSSAATVLFTPHLVPMDRGLLATCHARARRRASTRAAAARRPARRLRRRAVRRRDRRPAAPEGRPGDERRPRHRTGRRADRAGCSRCARSTTSGRVRRARRSSARTSRSGSTRPTGWRSRGCGRERRRARGVRAPRAATSGSSRPVSRTARSSRGTTAARPRRGRVHDEPRRRGTGPGLARRTSPRRAGRARAIVVTSGNANAATGRERRRAAPSALCDAVGRRARRAARRGPRRPDRPHRGAVRLRSRARRAGPALCARGGPTAPEGGAGRRRGDPHDRHASEDVRARATTASASARWRRARRCWPRTSPRCCAVLTTDAACEPALLARAPPRRGRADVQPHARRRRDASTNDTVFALASGLAGPVLAELARRRRSPRRARRSRARWSTTPRARRKTATVSVVGAANDARGARRGARGRGLAPRQVLAQRRRPLLGEGRRRARARRASPSSSTASTVALRRHGRLRGRRRASTTTPPRSPRTSRAATSSSRCDLGLGAGARLGAVLRPRAGLPRREPDDVVTADARTRPARRRGDPASRRCRTSGGSTGRSSS